MDRRLMLGTAIGAIATSPGLAMAQETAPDIEDRFAALKTRIAELEARVEVLESESGASAADDGASESAEAGDSIIVNGSGTSVSDPFYLFAGRYRVKVEMRSERSYMYFVLYLHDPSGAENRLLSEIYDGEGSHESSIVYQALEDGDYFVVIEGGDGDWTVIFEPF